MNESSTAKFNSTEARKALNLLCRQNDVVELRMPKTRWGTVSGYFNDMELLIKASAEYSGRVPGVYVTLNPLNPQLLARAHNRLECYAKWTTSDEDILQRRYIGIDVDPVRPAGISSTYEEHNSALTRAREIRDFLTSELGWTGPIFGDSGNGGHLLYRIDLPNDQVSRDLIRRSLEALDFRFSDQKVEVDINVFNAARIWKLYGTLSCKGDNIPERPHRLARIMEVK